MLGFMRYLSCDYDGACDAWTKAGGLDDDLVKLQAQKVPNVIKRLQSACRVKRMAFDKDIYSLVKDRKLEIKLKFAEMHYMLEGFKEMNELYSQILKSDDPPAYERAIALMGLANGESMLGLANSEDERETIGVRYEQAMQLGAKTPVAEEALMRLACFYDQGSSTKEKGRQLLAKYLKDYPKGKYVDKVKFCVGLDAFAQGDARQAERLLSELKAAYPSSTYTTALADIVHDTEQKKFIQDK
jgi:hypothetical protein